MLRFIMVLGFNNFTGLLLNVEINAPRNYPDYNYSQVDTNAAIERMLEQELRVATHKLVEPLKCISYKNLVTHVAITTIVANGAFVKRESCFMASWPAEESAADCNCCFDTSEVEVD